METSGGRTAPHHFACPISLQPMQDPVTAPTGISYDRRAIERWLADGHATCPVTGRPLSLTDLTPNHTLRRLILSWHRVSMVASEPDVAPTSEPDDPEVAVLVAKVMSPTSCPTAGVLCEAAASAAVNITARRCMVRAGVQWRVLRLLSSCGKTISRAVMPTVEACLGLIDALDVSADELRPIVSGNHDLVDALTHVLVTLENGTYSGGGGNTTRDSAVRLLDSVIESADVALLERLRPELFRAVTAVVRNRTVSPRATRAALRVLLNACPNGNGKNRILVAEAGVVHEAIELELSSWPSFPSGKSRRVTELVMALLARLCACAEGRAAVVAHPAGIALVAKRALRVSAATDTSAVRVLAAVCGRATSPEVVREMARVGAVGKLCCVLQADCDQDVKETARAVLRMHSGVWCGSPCVSAYLLSRYL
ncbi:U-box domain-containing protein 22 [Hordeum vulgare]|uniref:U-box domain-containing protein n=1 Tax=Hordeum vulgare subsp. vulgare TaxID=112509 RepID=A0A8I6YRX4_HORVV|nr:E3 ubiquitin-protein ligase PUB23-like [Hordeum vulgare subsp. vulgare]KAE8782895.1 U-box domain-containing protein 22 [Hordeum vulgare]